MLIYDGACGFCSRSALWIQRRLPQDVVVVPWQSIPDPSQYQLTANDLAEQAWWVDNTGETYGGAQAIAQSLLRASKPWSLLGRLIATTPFRWVAQPIYRAIAKRRHLIRWPGQSAASCGSDPAGRTPNVAADVADGPAPAATGGQVR